MPIHLALAFPFAVRPRLRPLWIGLPLLATAIGMQTAAAQSCHVRSGAAPVAVVELYTSEGCSSCPPADQWLSTLKPEDGVLALSFHVSYWNHLGWLDRFATPETTARQHRIKAASGSAYVYTPQVVLNGQDHRAWAGQSAKQLRTLPAAQAPTLLLTRSGNEVTAQIGPAASSTAVAGYWAVLQDGLDSKVTRGENAGAHLKHDHVVRMYQPMPAWSAAQAHTERITLPPDTQGHRVAFVVTDSSWTRPLQALALRCT
jgi:hypothetical protein